MPTVYQPADVLIGPIVHALATIITSQIGGVGKVYERDPDGSPIDNSVTIPLTDYKVLGDSLGRIELRMVFGICHWFRRGTLGAGVQSCYSYLIPYLQAFAEWDNQTLLDPAGQPLSRMVNVKQGGVTSKSYYKTLEPHVALVINVEVVTEFLISTAQ